jgi:hypothetical protein
LPQHTLDFKNKQVSNEKLILFNEDSYEMHTFD